MAVTSFTSGLRLTNQPTGGNANTWGDIADNNFEFIDDALTAQVCIDLTGANSRTLTVNNGADDESRNMTIKIAGIPTSSNSIIIPAVEKMYLIKADHTAVSGGITVRTDSGTGVNFLAGTAGVIYCDGVSTVQVAGLVSALDPSENLSDLGNTSAGLDNLGLQPQGPLFTSGTALDIKVSSPLEVLTSTLTINTSALKIVLGVILFPVGSIYTNRSDATNPGTLLGFGTWTAIGEGRVMVGVGTGTDINAVASTFASGTSGGEYKHTQTAGEIGAHSHTLELDRRQGNESSGSGSGAHWGGDNIFAGSAIATTDTSPSPTAMNVQQPWFSVFMWERTA